MFDEDTTNEFRSKIMGKLDEIIDGNLEEILELHQENIRDNDGQDTTTHIPLKIKLTHKPKKGNYVRVAMDAKRVERITKETGEALIDITPDLFEHAKSQENDDMLSEACCDCGVSVTIDDDHQCVDGYICDYCLQKRKESTDETIDWDEFDINEAIIETSVSVQRFYDHLQSNGIDPEEVDRELFNKVIDEIQDSKVKPEDLSGSVPEVCKGCKHVDGDPEKPPCSECDEENNKFEPAENNKAPEENKEDFNLIPESETTEKPDETGESAEDDRPFEMCGEPSKADPNMICTKAKHHVNEKGNKRHKYEDARLIGQPTNQVNHQPGGINVPPSSNHRVSTCLR